ncbi:MAG: TonB-dependent receptor [candidate division Zixibacteria bacterium]|nr:TonB-dependent receptor [candidate division Zixibacteria bacterium]
MLTSGEELITTRKKPIKGRSLNVRVIVALAVVMLQMSSITLLAGEVETGRATGCVLDAETGDPIIGATIMFRGTKLGAQADLDGNFWIKHIPEGTYTVRVSCVGYQATDILDVQVTPSEVVTLVLTLKSVVLEIGGMTVRGRAFRNTEAALLKKRQLSLVVSDAISSEDISRSGSGHAAEAMSKVTGASVVDGKFVYVRGLGDRYTNTHLNGSPLPSPDPDKQAVPLDLIPTGLLDNIVVEKSFTPDKPGNFAGGSVNLSTRDYPEKRTLNFTISTGYNTRTSLKDGMLSHNNSSTDWLGYDNGQRDIPDIILNNPEQQAAVNEMGRFLRAAPATYDSVLALSEYVSTSSKSFNNEMIHKTKHAPLNKSYSLSYGDLLDFFDRPLGVVASLTYNRKYSILTDGKTGLYIGENAVSQENAFNYSSGVDEVLWGGLANLTYCAHQNHKLSTMLMYNRNGESNNELFTGQWPYHYDENPNDSLRYRWLKYTERELRVLQFSGAHVGVGLPWLGTLGKSVHVDWMVSFSRTSQKEPDVRYFGDIKAYKEPGEFDYLILQTATDSPSRSWRTLRESNNEFNVDFSLPVSRLLKLKTGTSYLKKKRSFRDRRFEYAIFGSYRDFNGDIQAYVEDLGLNRIDTVARGTRYNFYFTNYLGERTLDLNQYDGDQQVFACYVMLESRVPKVNRLNFVGGLRYETTNMFGAVHDPDRSPGEIDEVDILPSVNFIYQAGDNANLRFSYGKTLSRPTMRELTPVHNEEFGDGRMFMGNEDLVHTRIDNWDVRWEWFMRSGEVMAVSGFYKVFDHPIEIAFVGQNGNVQVQNVDRGTVLGLEFEYRRRLDWLHSHLSNFNLGGNLTLVRSRVDIAESERKNYPEFNHERPMSNQSPYVVNLDIGYRSETSGTSASLFYNVFGRRFAVNSQLPSPDVYEEPRHQLDALFSQRLFGGPVLKLSAKNLLDEGVLFKYDCERPDGEEVIYKTYSRGISYGIGVSYAIW